MNRARIRAEVEAFVEAHFRPLNPFYPVDEDSAIVDRSMAKVRTAAARRGISPEAFSEEMELASPARRSAIMREVNEVRVDPRTGGGLS